MEIVIIVAITLFAYWTIGTIIYWALNENETFAALWCMGLVYWILYVVCAPIRMIRKHLIRKGK